MIPEPREIIGLVYLSGGMGLLVTAAIEFRNPLPRDSPEGPWPAVAVAAIGAALALAPLMMRTFR